MLPQSSMMGDLVNVVHEYLYTSSSHQQFRGGSSWSDFGLYKKIWGIAPFWLLELHNSSRPDARFACISHRGAEGRGQRAEGRGQRAEVQAAECRMQSKMQKAVRWVVQSAVCSLQQHSFVQFKTRNEGNTMIRDASILVRRTGQSSFQSNRSTCPLPSP